MKVFISHSLRDRELAAAIAAQLKDHGDAPLDPFSSPLGNEGISRIFADMRSADMVVAILSATTPNVFYELGVAVGAGLPVLMVGSAGESIPADMAALPFVQLTGNVDADAPIVTAALSRIRPPAPREPKEFASAEAELRAALGDPKALESLVPDKFEFLIREWFKARGYETDEPPQRKEFGFDFLVKDREDHLIVEVKKMAVQTRVSVDAIRSLVGAVRYWNAKGGLLISASGFTSAATELARSTRVLLCTLDELLNTKSLDELWRRVAANKALQQTGHSAPRS